jgi:hypothetical protein
MRYIDLQLLVKRTHNRVMQSCWIADVKEKNGLPLRSPDEVGRG